jgi:glycosyltransferase involved in cell wall biosynthesis
MVRIALLLPDLGLGGAERVTLTLAAEFLKLGDAVDVVLLRREGALLTEIPAGARLVVLDAPRIRDAVRPLGEYCSRERPDAMLAAMWPLSSIAVWAARRTRTRVVVIEHVNLSAFVQSWRPLPRALLRPILRWSHPRAAARVAVSQGAAQDLARWCGLPANRVVAIPNPVPMPVPQETSNAPDWGGSGRRILNVGTLKAQKNHLLLLDAFSRIAKPDDRLAIVGEGSERVAIERHAAALGIAHQLLLPGNDLDPGRWYASADVFVLSSDYEGLPTVLIEALSHGLAAVSTDCPSGPAEILAGLGPLVPVGDAAALADGIEAALTRPADPVAAKARAVAYAPAPIAARYRALLLADSS